MTSMDENDRRELIVERRVICTDRRTSQRMEIYLRIFRRTKVSNSPAFTMTQMVLENSFAGGEIEVPGIDAAHALGLCLMHAESFLLHLNQLHEIEFDGGIRFDPSLHSAFFGSTIEAIRSHHSQ